MSRENVERHHRANEAFNSRDVAAYLEYCDPRIELHSAVTVPGGTVYYGHGGVRRWHRDLEEVFGGEIKVEPEAYFSVGDQTVTFHHLRGRGQRSGANVETWAAHVCTWREGLIVYFKGYTHKEDVLRELGVSEDQLEAINP
jgi:hypothetical protein